MRLTAFSDVSLRLLLVLSSAPDSTLLTTRELADMVGTPYNHVSKSVLKLRQMGLIEAIRGRSGGVRITSAGMSASVGSVLRVLSDHEDAASCHSDMGDCPLLPACGLRGVLNHAREAFYASLDSVVISSLAVRTPPGPVPVTLNTSRLG